MRANSSSSGAAKARPCNLKRPTPKPSASSSALGHRTLLCEEHVLGVVLRPISELEPYTLNARSHPRAQLEKLAASIREFGFLIPILVDREDRIIAGHARAEAARLLGLAEVPTIAIHHLCDAQIRAFRIADNRLAELAQWDEQALAIELKALSELDLSFDVEITGFELAEIDILIERAEEGGDPDEADEIPELDETTPPVSEVGDLWRLAEHRLLCADALRPDSYERLLEGETAQMVFTDPPYNVRINGHVGGAGKIKHAEFVMASGEMSEGEFTTFLATVLSNLASQSADGALIYSCMDWRHGYELETASRKAGLKLLNLCVWNKDNGGMGSFYRSKHELVFVFKHGSAPHINNIELGQYGRYRTNVWDYAGVNTLRHGRLEELAMHPTVKPVALVADAIKDCTGRGHIVLDAFAGSGTTIIAAEKTGRVGCALELDPRYIDVAIKRWDRLSPKKAVHAETGLSFDELAAARRAAVEARCMKRPRALLMEYRTVAVEVRRRRRPAPPPTTTSAGAEPDATEGVAHYEVGYKRPPKETQFQPGQSGNPNGRPKGARNLKTDLADELQERIVLREGGERRTVSKQRAMLKRLMEREPYRVSRRPRLLEGWGP